MGYQEIIDSLDRGNNSYSNGPLRQGPRAESRPSTLHQTMTGEPAEMSLRDSLTGLTSIFGQGAQFLGSTVGSITQPLLGSMDEAFMTPIGRIMWNKKARDESQGIADEYASRFLAENIPGFAQIIGDQAAEGADARDRAATKAIGDRYVAAFRDSGFDGTQGYNPASGTSSLEMIGERAGLSAARKQQAAQIRDYMTGISGISASRDNYRTKEAQRNLLAGQAAHAFGQANSANSTARLNDGSVAAAVARQQAKNVRQDVLLSRLTQASQPFEPNQSFNEPNQSFEPYQSQNPIDRQMLVSALQGVLGNTGAATQVAADVSRDWGIEQRLSPERLQQVEEAKYYRNAESSRRNRNSSKTLRNDILTIKNKLGPETNTEVRERLNQAEALALVNPELALKLVKEAVELSGQRPLGHQDLSNILEEENFTRKELERLFAESGYKLPPEGIVGSIREGLSNLPLLSWLSQYGYDERLDTAPSEQDQREGRSPKWTELLGNPPTGLPRWNARR